MTNLIDVAANKFATRRTKNRIKENGPTFSVEHQIHPKPGFLLLKSTRTSWLGWIPIGEIQEIQHHEND